MHWGCGYSGISKSRNKKAAQKSLELLFAEFFLSDLLGIWCLAFGPRCFLFQLSIVAVFSVGLFVLVSLSIIMNFACLLNL